MSQALEVNKDNFNQEVLSSPIPVLVDFWAPWCGPCRMMAPVLDEIAIEMAGKLKVVKVNTEDGQNQDLAIQYQIQSIPNMKVFKEGRIVGEFIGLRSKDSLSEDLAKII